MKCVYENEATIAAKYAGKTTTTAQDGDVASAALSLKEGFTFETMNANNEVTDIFTVGQTMTFKLSYDVAAAGYDGKLTDMPFGYVVEKCHAKNMQDENQKFYLIGSTDDSLLDTCPFTSDFFDINLEQSYAGGNNYWTSTDYTLKYDAFKIGGSDDLNLVCDIQICLTDKCPTEKTECTTTGKPLSF